MKIQHLWKPLVPGAMCDLSAKLAAGLDRQYDSASKYLARVANKDAWEREDLAYEERRDLSEEAVHLLSSLTAEAEARRTSFRSIIPIKFFEVLTYAPALYMLSSILTKGEINPDDAVISAIPLGLRYLFYQDGMTVLKQIDGCIEWLESLLNRRASENL